MTDSRRSSPAAQRNRAPLVEILRGVLPPRGLVLEVASGSGEHVLHFAAAFPELTFQPTDPDMDARRSIDAWAADAAAGGEHPNNIRPALPLDAAADNWPVTAADALLCINMIHISPWPATLGLARGAGRILGPDGVVILYGPYRRGGAHTAPSNAAFDADLRRRNPAWGVRDIEAVAAAFAAQAFGPPEIIEMPANNFSLIFRLHPATPR